jgi:hypothetical protein
MKTRLSFLLLCVAVLTACGRFEGTFRFLREEPKKEAIPGIFTLDRSSYSDGMLRSMGYTDLSVRVALNQDGTFSISRMPDCWLTDWSDSKGGYDSCSGTWSLYKSYSVYTVSLNMDRWAGDSTFIRKKKDPRFGFTAAFTLTKEKEGYGLALALAAGDKGYVYFRRENRG